MIINNNHQFTHSEQMNIDPTPLHLQLIDIDILTLGQAVHTDRSSKRASVIFSPLFPFQALIITIII